MGAKSISSCAHSLIINQIFDKCNTEFVGSAAFWTDFNTSLDYVKLNFLRSVNIYLAPHSFLPRKTCFYGLPRPTLFFCLLVDLNLKYWNYFDIQIFETVHFVTSYRILEGARWTLPDMRILGKSRFMFLLCFQEVRLQFTNPRPFILTYDFLWWFWVHPGCGGITP
jgi:hypothetical protein